MHVQVLYFEANTRVRQMSSAQDVHYRIETQDYSAIISNLKPGGTYDITITAMSNGKSSETAMRQHTLGVSFT